MAKQTFSYTHTNGKTYSRDSVKVYTHLVLFTTADKEGVYSWHISQAHAEKEIKKIRNCVGRDYYKNHEFTVVELAA